MEPTLQIDQGKIRGRILEDYQGKKFYGFQGIPYAKPPIGELRFKAPQPPEKWEGIRDCTKEGSQCWSKDFFDLNKVGGSEDCLFANVYTSQLPDGKSKPKPVMFWIHGGGFTMGSSNTDIYGPEYLITGDIVLVSLNYRLGIFGFLSLEDPTLNVPGNNGLKDMVMALKWVQKNISVFGGDPNNVTIFGESAGGAATHLLVLSPMTKGLFHKAIPQSGCALNPWAQGSRSAKLLAEKLNIKSDSEKEILAKLKTVSAKEIFDAQTELYDGLDADRQRLHAFVVEKPCSEPAFLTEHPLDIIMQGKQNKVPMIMGFTSKEGMLTEMWHKRNNSWEMLSDFERTIPFGFKIEKGTELSMKVAQKFKDFYFSGKQPTDDMMEEFYALETDRFFLRGIYMTVKHQVKALPNLPLYFYRFDIDSGLNLLKIMAQIKNKGASHCDELGYLFHTQYLPKIQKGSIEEKLMKRMVGIWTTFARTGNPNPIIDSPNVKWEPVTANQFNCLNIDEEVTSRKELPEKERMKFWDELCSIVPAIKNM